MRKSDACFADFRLGLPMLVHRNDGLPNSSDGAASGLVTWGSSGSSGSDKHDGQLRVGRWNGVGY